MVETEAGARRGLRWVLVADGDEKSARTLVSLVLRQGLWAYPTARGDEALRVAEALQIILAVIDVALEDMAGHELAACLRTIDPGLPVIMTSGDSRPELEVHARQVGIVHYAHKPIDDRRLEAVLAKTLGTPPVVPTKTRTFHAATPASPAAGVTSARIPGKKRETPWPARRSA